MTVRKTTARLVSGTSTNTLRIFVYLRVSTSRQAKT
jgi:hypothetical protein